MGECVISLEGNANDRLPSFRYLVEALSPMRRLQAGAQAALDLSKMRYLGPDGVALIAGSVLEARSRQVDVAVRTPVDPQPLMAFLEFSGFNHLVLSGPVPERDHPENVTVPLRRFERARHDDPEPIVQLVSRFEPVSEDLRLSLEISVTECVQNIEDHSRSPVGGLGCARFMKRDHEVRVALIDWGDGILTSLRRQYPDTRDDVHALQRVLYGGYSAKTRANNFGRGIDNLRSIVTEAFGGSLYIVSGHGAVDIRGHRPPRYHAWPCAFGGTAVCFTLPVQPRSGPKLSDGD